MDASKIDGLLGRAADEGALPGVAAIEGDRDGALYEGAFGVVSVDGGAPVAPDTMFWIASMTKSIVSVGALQLVEQGDLELDQPAAEVVPELGRLQVLEGFDGDEPRLRPPARPVTIRNLLTHTSGLSYWWANADLMRYHRITGTPTLDSGRLAALEVPLVADPGTRWEYGTSHDWLGRVVETVSGQDLERYCREGIFDPLAMKDATFDPDDERRARLMSLHARTPEGGLVPISAARPPNPEFWSGGAGAYATAPDYLRFTRALLRGGELDGERILRPETLELMLTNQLGEVELPAAIPTALPELTNEIPFFPISQGWGLGIHLVLESLPGMRSSGTAGWAGLSNCFYWIDRAAGVTGVFLTQVLPAFDARVVETAFGFEAGVYEAVATPAAG
jgi:CubicO group peptidase (beta-lactamase class C family)